LRSEWVTLHPLHSFSGEYNAQNKLVSYLNEDRYKTRITILEKEKDQKLFSFEMVDINEIGRFMQNPARYYLQKRFNIFYNSEDVLLVDHELFGFDQLTKWGVQDNVMTMTQDEVDVYKKSVKNSGKVKGKEVVQLYYNDLVASITPSVKKLTKFSKIELKLKITNIIRIDS
jgi:exonuclease V gamma subunit